MLFRAIIIAVPLAFSLQATAADLGDGPESSACVPHPIREELMQAWDFGATPYSILGASGFQLANRVRTVLVNDTGALSVVLGLGFTPENEGAVATGLGRAACVCERAGSTAYGAAIRRAAETRGSSFSGAFNAALQQCLHPVPFFGGPRGGTYGNVSPTKVGVSGS